MFIHLYLLSCNYFWMLCEGIYLHTLIVVAVFAEKQHLMWYYLLGWGKYSTVLYKYSSKFKNSNVINGLICRFSSGASGDTFNSTPLLLQRQVSHHLDKDITVNHVFPYCKT